MTDVTHDPLWQVRYLAAVLKDAEAEASATRRELYAAVSDARASGAPTMDIAQAANWRTKKAVYDACRAVGKP